jgi:aspartyl-tRNA(Asn)/glutamyl-tRNA(Gln) amidotransferase subunit A
VAGLRQSLAALAAGKVTATGLAQQALERAKLGQARVNAFSVIAEDRALQAAEESDRRYATGRPRALEGLPITIKDLIDTQGIETRYGSAAYAGHVPTQDAELVRALVHQGAVIVGKTTTHEFAWGATTASDAFGDTRNPLDTTRIPGGSSGGAAASIADGTVAAGIGTDTGGSVRIPAALCGVVGYKPSHGVLPTQGIFPLSPSLDHPGLLGARVDDVVVLAQALGIGRGMEGQGAAPRLGIVRRIGPIAPSDGVRIAFDQALERIGGVFTLSEIDTHGLFDEAYAAFASIVLTEGGITHFSRNDWIFITARYGAETVDRLTRAKTLTLGGYAQAQATRRRFASALGDAMRPVDFLVLPTLPCTAPLIGQAELRIGDWTGSVREALMTYTAPFNLAGWPAISIPLQSRSGGLPAALQIVGRPGEDGALLHLAQRVEAMLE